ncbi:hypothetical protein [Methanoregula boonei]|jgi:succinate dehydrogenase hydrophobic anchor subunit|uniref:hypothetical protein n=1 Tax=Methanoregula boonei TaxID=358766 RepID=UPI0012FAE9E2|nr:hypothetical protein [Methanoregula boonei]
MNSGKKANSEICFFVTIVNKVTIFIPCYICGFILAVLIESLNVTPTFPNDYFSQIANACIVVLSVIIATIYAVIAIVVSQKDTIEIKQKSRIRSCLTGSIIPFLGIGSSLLSLILSAFSYDEAKIFLAIAVFITVTSFGVTYLVMTRLFPADENKS